MDGTGSGFCGLDGKSHRIKNFPWSVVHLAMATVLVAFHSVTAHADTVFVWSEDGTIKHFTTNGVGSVLVGNGVPGWNGPVGLTVDNDGYLYSGCPGTSRVLKYTADGIGSEVGFADSVSALAFDRVGSIYMTIPNYSGLCRGYFTVNCTQSHLSSPISLALDSSGNIYVATGVYPYPYGATYTNTIAKFSPDFTYLGDFATNLNKPWGLAFDQAADLFVSNSGTNGVLSNTIFRIKPNGSLLFFANAGINNPRGLAFDSAGNLYVANGGDGTIRKFTPDGTGSIFATGLIAPTSIAIQPGLKLWPTPITLVNPKTLTDGTFQFGFANSPGMSFSALVNSNVSSSISNWAGLGGVSEIAPGQYLFVDLQATNNPQRFYRVRSN